MVLICQPYVRRKLHTAVFRQDPAFINLDVSVSRLVYARWSVRIRGAALQNLKKIKNND